MNEKIINQEICLTDMVLSLNDLKAMFRIGNDKALKLIERSDFPSFRVGKQHFIPLRELLDWMGKQALSKAIITFASGFNKEVLEKRNLVLEKAMENGNVIFTIEEVAEAFEIDRLEALKLLELEDFPSFIIGGKHVIPLNELVMWLRKNAESKSTLLTKSKLSDFLESIDD